MKITICGSIAFLPVMLDAQKVLEAMGHEVRAPLSEFKNEQGETITAAEYYIIRKAATSNDGWIWDRKEEAIRRHFDKVKWSDAILVVNEEKNGIPGYIWANTLMEMGLAFHLRKPIFLLHEIPELSYKEEILGMRPMLIDENLSRIS